MKEDNRLEMEYHDGKEFWTTGFFFHGESQDYIVFKEAKKTLDLFTLPSGNCFMEGVIHRKRFNKKKFMDDVQTFQNKRYFENEVLFWIQHPNGL
jgi:hypothetical protein